MSSVAEIFSEGCEIGHIYKIKAPSNAYDIIKLLGKSSPFPWEQKVAIPKNIPAKNIVSSKKIGE